MNEKILKAIKELREKSKKRNFPQTFDLVVNLRELDVKKSENKFSEDVVLPNGRGDLARVAVFSDSIKGIDCEILGSADMDRLAKNKREAKNLAKRADFLLAEPKLMPTIGKVLGQFIGPKGKLPKIITGDVKSLVENYKKSVRIRIKDAPVVQCSVGKENMDDEKIVENIETVLKALETKLPKGKNNFKEMFVKLTMSKPVKVEM